MALALTVLHKGGCAQYTTKLNQCVRTAAYRKEFSLSRRSFIKMPLLQCIFRSDWMQLVLQFLSFQLRE